MPLVSGVNSSKELEKLMLRYQQAKDGYQKSHGEKKVQWSQDMKFWEQRLLSAGAMSVRFCAIPPRWAGGPDAKFWVNRREKAQKEVARMRLLGLPNHA